MLSFPRRCGIGNLNSLAQMGSCCVANQLRQYSDKEKCAKNDNVSKCGLVLNEYPCGEKAAVPYVAKAAVSKPPLVSMWKIENCEPDLCVLDLRYDMKYYRITDKRKRKYQVTWNECPRLLIKPRKVCLSERMVRPKIKRRKRISQSGAGGSVATAKPCGTDKKKGKCVYVVNPCCKTGRRPPKCKSAFPSLGNCEKRKAPYPSFSECKKDPTIPLPPIECRCLDLPALCDAWAILRRRVAKGQKPVKICGEA